MNHNNIPDTWTVKEYGQSSFVRLNCLRMPTKQVSSMTKKKMGKISTLSSHKNLTMHTNTVVNSCHPRGEILESMRYVRATYIEVQQIKFCSPNSYKPWKEQVLHLMPTFLLSVREGTFQGEEPCSSLLYISFQKPNRWMCYYWNPFHEALIQPTHQQHRYVKHCDKKNQHPLLSESRLNLLEI